MRRWIFALLLLANVGLFLWGLQFLEPERPARSAAPREINAERMPLLKDMAPNKLLARPKPAPPPPPVPSTDGQSCYRLGPIAETEQLKQVESDLGAQALAFTKREESARQVTGYRVYLPPFPTRADAERRRRDLTRLGFSDHALMQEEGYQNAISLGLFAVEANAQNHLKRLAERGIEAQMLAVEQSRSVHWLEVTPGEGASDVAARLKAIAVKFAGAESTPMPCPAPVAPAAPVSESPAPP